MKTTRLTIGKLSTATCTGIETIRFYEHKGLISPPERLASGYRLYTQEDILRLRFIKTSKELGFSLSEIRDLLNLRVVRGTDAGDIKKRALAKIDEITEKIENLKRIKRTLARITDQCCGEGPLDKCPILKALDTGAKSSPKGNRSNKRISRYT